MESTFQYIYISIRIYIYVEQCVCVFIYIYSIDMHTFYLIYHTSPCITEFIYIIYGLQFFVGQVFLKRWKNECKRAAAADEWSDPVGDGFPPRETNAWWKVSFWEILWRVSELSHVKWQRKCRYSNIPAFSRRLVTQLEMFRPLEPRLLRLSLIYHCWISCQVQQNARNHAWNTSATLSTIRITSCQGQGLRQMLPVTTILALQMCQMLANPSGEKYTALIPVLPSTATVCAMMGSSVDAKSPASGNILICIFGHVSLEIISS